MRKLSDPRALEVIAVGLHSQGLHTRALVGFAGRRAVELGCASEGPVQIAPSTWAYRSATGTKVWHRRPTPAETRELATGARRATKTQTRRRKPATTQTSADMARVERLFK